MRQFRDLSIKTKLNVLLGVSAALALLLACATFMINDVTSIRSSMVSHLSAVADVVGANTVAAITFDDRVVAAEALSSLRHEPNVRFACVYDRSGQPFATYRREDLSAAPTPPPVREDGHRFTSNGTLEIFATVSDAEEAIGHLYVEAGLKHIEAHAARILALGVGVLAVSLAVALLMSSKLQAVVTRPVVELAETAKRISRQHDYSVRVNLPGNDEIGTLCREFNAMLSEIDRGRLQLRKARDDLELRVQERTQQLSKAVQELQQENAERRRAEEELRALQVQHVATARRVGMAEVATSVLHNVGNVLNSVNVSTSLISDRIRSFGVADFQRAAAVVQEHLDDLPQYIAEDERGKHLPRFLIELAGQMAAAESEVRDELTTLTKNVDHVKDIISVQQTHAGVSGLIEEVDLAEMIDDAIRINTASAERHRIEIVRELEHLPPVLVQKHKLLQIVVNLISNAKYALIESDTTDRRIVVRLTCTEDDRVRLEVVDNGIGIPAENLTRIFSHGFTTRREGHGFGLHSAALAVSDLNGTLSVHSDGLHEGATFTLEIPRQAAEVEPCTPQTTNN